VESLIFVVFFYRFRSSELVFYSWFSTVNFVELVFYSEFSITAFYRQWTSDYRIFSILNCKYWIIRFIFIFQFGDFLLLYIWFSTVSVRIPHFTTASFRLPHFFNFKLQITYKLDCLYFNYQHKCNSINIDSTKIQ